MGIIDMRLAAAILLSIAACWFAAAAGFSVGLTMTAAPALIGFMVGVLYLAIGSGRRPTPASIVSIALFVILTGGTLALTALFKDLSWDGNSYHLDALQQLASGWNPFREITPTGAAFPEWLAYFTKGPWFTTTSTYLLTGSMNAAKYASLLLIAPAGLVGWELFGARTGAEARSWAYRWGVGLFCAVLWMLNPIALVQLFSKYVDGQLSVLAGVLVALLLLPHAQRQKRDWRVAFGAAIILLINVKLTGALIAAIVIGGLLIGDRLAAVVAGRRAMHSPVYGPGTWATVIGAGLIAVFIGWNPYVTQYARNLIEYRAPFYPTDYAALTHLDYNTPESLRGKGALQKGLIATFSATDAIVADAYQLKIPFTVSLDELAQFGAPDARFGGFGPWWSGIVILAVAVLIIGWRRVPGVAWAMLALLAASVLINPELWWARYVPQAWLLPILILYYTLRRGAIDPVAGRLTRARLLVGLQGLLGVAMIGNVLLVGIPAIVLQIKGNLGG